ncbi:MAG: acyl-CoA dehydrogenase family protein [Bacteriovoracaceae bacterium]|nr:acyl-CoA dehydrogenase family protein [Bacteriovoracaceae bacterium]
MSTNGSNAQNGTEIPSIAKALFFGHVHEENVFPFPHWDTESVETGKSMVDAVKRYAETSFQSAKYDLEGQLPKEILAGLAELGLFGLGVPEDLGGLNLNYKLYARVFSEISAYDGAIATTLGAHQSIGYKALLNEGNDQQKKKWLPKLASGECLAAFCLTEPGSGSDAYSIKTKAIKNAAGNYVINGQKLWITNGGIAGFYSVFCKTEHEGEGGKKVDKISCFIVEKERKGISFGNKEDKMGIRASETRAVFFDNVEVPAENLIGELGKGFKIAMNVLNTGRLSLGSGSVGAMKSVIKMAVAHAKNRKQFGKSISEYGLIQEKISGMAANIYAAESVVYLTTGKIDQGMVDYSMESAICKVYCSEKLWDTVDKGLQIAAGNGYMKEYPYERLMRDARINLIFEGTNEILRVFIALTGIKDPSDSLKELGKIADVSKALADPIKSLGVVGQFAKSRLTKMISTKKLELVHPDLSEQSDDFSEMLQEFAIKVENTLFKLGPNIIGNEMPQMRLANCAIELYAQLATLVRTTAILNNPKISNADKDYVKGMTQLICINSKQNFIMNVKRLFSDFDRMVPKVSEMVCQRDGFGFDIIDF